MQKSFSVVDDENSFDTNPEKCKEKQRLVNNQYFSESSDSDENSLKQVNLSKLETKHELVSKSVDNPIDVNLELHKTRQPNKNLTGDLFLRKNTQLQSDSEESFIEKNREFLDEYDPKVYENLEVDDECKEILQYITKYAPQRLNLDYTFKPFIPDYFPAVGDIDAFLKIAPPEVTINKEKFNENSSELGLWVLDEPAANQSDPALLYLQLRVKTVNLDKTNKENVVVKTVNKIEKNGKIIDKWIKDISDLYKSKSSSVIRYNENMPDLDTLMQQWSDEMETHLKTEGFPKPEEHSDLLEYIKVICNFFEIPISKKKIYSLHLLFCLSAAIQQTQLYQDSANNVSSNSINVKKDTDQLVLD